MCDSSGSARMRWVSVDRSIGSKVKHLTIEQLAVGYSWFDTHAARVMSGDKVPASLSVRT